MVVIVPASISGKFERVVTKPSAATRKVSGFGLGLNFVVNVIRAHGGYVGVESVEGKYSEFAISLPLPVEGTEKKQ